MRKPKKSVRELNSFERLTHGLSFRILVMIVFLTIFIALMILFVGVGMYFQTMLDDAGRQTYTINGTKYLHGTDVGGLTGPDQHRVVIDAFRAAVPDPKARKALSVLMNQSGPGDLVQAIMHVPADGEGGPVNLHELGGADKLINRNEMTGLHMIALHEPTMSFGLDVAPDGRIHSSFNQTETRTGRISSTEPNLQNIPVRTERGKEFRPLYIDPESRSV